MSKKAADKSDSASEMSGEVVPGLARTEHVHEMAAILGLSIRLEWEDAVVLNLGMLESAAEQVLSFELPDDIEPAVVFLTI